MSKSDFPDNQPPCYTGSTTYPQQQPPAYALDTGYPVQYPQQAPAHAPAYAPATGYPMQYPQQPPVYIQQPVVSPNQVLIQSNPVGNNSTVVIQGQPVNYCVVGAQNSPAPVSGVCPKCQQTITTRVEYSIGTYTWMVAGILSILGLCACACIPCCMDSCKDAQHYCPACNNYLGIHQRLKL